MERLTYVYRWWWRWGKIVFCSWKLVLSNSVIMLPRSVIVSMKIIKRYYFLCPPRIIQYIYKKKWFYISVDVFKKMKFKDSLLELDNFYFICKLNKKEYWKRVVAERKNFKLLFSVRIILPLGFQFIYFVLCEWFMSFCRMTSPGNMKTGVTFFRALFLIFRAEQTDSLLHLPFLTIPAAVIDHHNMRWAHSNFGLVFL